jgi:alkylhydroperoxidase family enzyme
VFTVQLEAQAHTREGLDQAWATLAAPGGWFTGAERVALAAEVRTARGCALCAERKAALSPYSVGGEHPGAAGLSSSVLEAAHRISTDPGRLSQRWYQQTLDSGLRPEEVVEITGIAGVVTIADTLAAALGNPLRPLPGPRPGEPARALVPGTEVSGGWVPMVHPDRAEGPVKDMYAMVRGSAGFVFNVARALTAVPVALVGFFRAFSPNYNTHGEVPDGGLIRPQVELLAATTSALNDCFY